MAFLSVRRLAPLTIAVLLFMAAPALAGVPATNGQQIPYAAPGSAKANLRAIETAGLGAPHAAEHAQQRALADEAAAAERANPRPAARAAAVAGSPRVSAENGGSWGPELDIPVHAITAAMLPTGKILMFAYPGRPGNGYENLARAYLWDPVTHQSEQLDPPTDPNTGKPTNIWCSGISILADGRALVTGGNLGDPSLDLTGLNTVFTFDPWTKQWKREQPMRQGRWYPSQLRMPDGRSIIMSGHTAPGDPDYSGSFRNTDIETFSPDGSLERDDLRLNQPGAPGVTGLYPHLAWMPSGRALVSGPENADSWYYNPGTPGQTSSSVNLKDLNAYRIWGTSFLTGNKVWMLGGSPVEPPSQDQPATSTTEIFDDTNPGAGWTNGPAMRIGRSHANSVLLPDGKAATIGGGYGNDPAGLYKWEFNANQRGVELLDPSTGQSTLGAEQREGRTYHSTALLLPDGRVFSAGDDVNGRPAAADDPNTPKADETLGQETGTRNDTAEIYSPPYLFRGPRPVIDQAPTGMPLGTDFEIAASGASATRAVLVAPGAATHAADFNQRIVNLPAPISRRGGRLLLHIPSDGNIALPGYYMLFLLSADGVPSVAKFIRIGVPAASGLLPGSGTGGPGNNTGRPRMRLTGKLPSLRTLRRTKRFRIAVTVSEPGTITLSARLGDGAHRGKALAGSKKITFRTAGKRAITFKLTRAGLRLLRHRKKGLLRINATAKLRSSATIRTHIVRKLR